ncbi:unnamed protein product [Amoebophrya sp. A120]|nr:unnamed protein product [Amoebophrya sp. A120]|eukprot:GSA120T00023586001.1
MFFSKPSPVNSLVEQQKDHHAWAMTAVLGSEVRVLLKSHITYEGLLTAWNPRDNSLLLTTLTNPINKHTTSTEEELFPPPLNLAIGSTTTPSNSSAGRRSSTTTPGPAPHPETLLLHLRDLLAFETLNPVALDKKGTRRQGKLKQRKNKRGAEQHQPQSTASKKINKVQNILNPHQQNGTSQINAQKIIVQPAKAGTGAAKKEESKKKSKQLKLPSQPGGPVSKGVEKTSMEEKAKDEDIATAPSADAVQDQEAAVERNSAHSPVVGEAKPKDVVEKKPSSSKGEAEGADAGGELSHAQENDEQVLGEGAPAGATSPHEPQPEGEGYYNYHQNRIEHGGSAPSKQGGKNKNKPSGGGADQGNSTTSAWGGGKDNKEAGGAGGKNKKATSNKNSKSSGSKNVNFGDTTNYHGDGTTDQYSTTGAYNNFTEGGGGAASTGGPTHKNKKGGKAGDPGGKGSQQSQHSKFSNQQAGPAQQQVLPGGGVRNINALNLEPTNPSIPGGGNSFPGALGGAAATFFAKGNDKTSWRQGGNQPSSSSSGGPPGSAKHQGKPSTSPRSQNTSDIEYEFSSFRNVTRTDTGVADLFKTLRKSSGGGTEMTAANNQWVPMDKAGPLVSRALGEKGDHVNPAVLQIILQQHTGSVGLPGLLNPTGNALAGLVVGGAGQQPFHMGLQLQQQPLGTIMENNAAPPTGGVGGPQQLPLGGGGINPGQHQASGQQQQQYTSGAGGPQQPQQQQQAPVLNLQQLLVQPLNLDAATGGGAAGAATTSTAGGPAQGQGGPPGGQLQQPPGAGGGPPNTQQLNMLPPLAGGAQQQQQQNQNLSIMLNTGGGGGGAAGTANNNMQQMSMEQLLQMQQFLTQVSNVGGVGGQQPVVGASTQQGAASQQLGGMQQLPQQLLQQQQPMQLQPFQLDGTTTGGGNMNNAQQQQNMNMTNNAGFQPQPRGPSQVGAGAGVNMTTLNQQQAGQHQHQGFSFTGLTSAGPPAIQGNVNTGGGQGGQQQQPQPGVGGPANNAQAHQ